MNALSPLETLAGQSILMVHKTDGTSEQVIIKQVKLRDLEQYADVQGDEAKQIEFLCGKDPGWVDSLENDSAEAIIVKGNELNADFFSRWLTRQMAKQESLMPGSVAKVMESLGLKQSEPEKNGSATQPSPQVVRLAPASQPRST